MQPGEAWRALRVCHVALLTRLCWIGLIIRDMTLAAWCATMDFRVHACCLIERRADVIIETLFSLRRCGPRAHATHAFFHAFDDGRSLRAPWSHALVEPPTPASFRGTMAADHATNLHEAALLEEGRPRRGGAQKC